jgi:hypothetical protein
MRPPGEGARAPATDASPPAPGRVRQRDEDGGPLPAEPAELGVAPGHRRIQGLGATREETGVDEATEGEPDQEEKPGRRKGHHLEEDEKPQAAIPTIGTRGKKGAANAPSIRPPARRRTCQAL